MGSLLEATDIVITISMRTMKFVKELPVSEVTTEKNRISFQLDNGYFSIDLDELSWDEDLECYHTTNDDVLIDIIS